MDWREQSSAVKFTSGSLLALYSSSSTCSKKSLPQISWTLPYAALFLSSWPSIRSFNILLTFSHSSSVYDGHHASAFGSWTSVPIHSTGNSASSFQSLSLPPGSTVFTRMSVRGRSPESTSESVEQFPPLPTLIRGFSLSPSFPPLFLTRHLYLIWVHDFIIRKNSLLVGVEANELKKRILPYLI